jgi:hypothetical protein
VPNRKEMWLCSRPSDDIVRKIASGEAVVSEGKETTQSLPSNDFLQQ